MHATSEGLSRTHHTNQHTPSRAVRGGGEDSAQRLLLSDVVVALRCGARVVCVFLWLSCFVRALGVACVVAAWVRGQCTVSSGIALSCGISVR